LIFLQHFTVRFGSIINVAFSNDHTPPILDKKLSNHKQITRQQQWRNAAQLHEKLC